MQLASASLQRLLLLRGGELFDVFAHMESKQAALHYFLLLVPINAAHLEHFSLVLWCWINLQMLFSSGGNGTTPSAPLYTFRRDALSALTFHASHGTRSHISHEGALIGEAFVAV